MSGQSRLFGNSIDPRVVEELTRREELLSKSSNSESVLSETSRVLESLKYNTQRGGWVRMISSVDVLNDAGQFSPEVSKRFLLTGGEIDVNGVRKEGISFTEFDTTKTYRKTQTTGVRPEAGITSLSISHKGTYGSLREATVTFNVWSREDLEIAQNLYLRPGIHVILEWGHTIDTNIQPTVLPDVTPYFNYPTRNRVQEYVNTQRDANLNYEGFIGLVTNFNWTLRIDGGYDCSIRIISTGAILEALTLLNGAEVATTRELQQIEVQDLTEVRYSRRSELHLLLTFLQKHPWPKIEIDSSNLNLTQLTDVQNLGGRYYGRVSTLDLKGENQNLQLPSRINDILRRIPATFFPIIGNDMIKNTARNVAHRLRYIPLRFLFMFLNETRILPKSSEGANLTELFTQQTVQREDGSLSSEIEPSFKTFPEHFSLDPGKVVLPKKPFSSDQRINNSLQNTTPPSDFDGIFKNLTKTGTSEKVLDIIVELGYVVSVLDRNIVVEEDNLFRINVYNFITDLLKGISFYLGNVNSLDLQFDESLQKYLVVDRETTNSSLKNSQIGEISITGIRSTGGDFQIQTKITPELSSQIAISAQGTSSLFSGNLNADLPLIQWNYNIQDRFNKKIETIEEEEVENVRSQNFSILNNTTPTSADNTRTSQDLNIAFLKDLPRTNYLDSFLTPIETLYLDFKKYNNSEYEEEKFSSLHQYGVSFFRERYLIFIQPTDNSNTSDPGIIPIELEVNLDGIGGLKIGQVFKIRDIEEFLPSVYENYGFIITGLDNKIESDKWTTGIRALTFKIPS